MADLKLTSRSLLSLLQWCDSLFPSGAFAHSFGLESAVDSGKVRNGKDLSVWIRAKLLHQVFPCDLVLLHQAYEAGLSNDLEAIQKIDATGDAMRLPREIREGGRMIASRLIQTGVALYPHSWIKDCDSLLSAGKLKGDPAVAFAIVSVGATISVEAASLAYLYMLISGQVSASLRLISIGQQEGQGIIHSLLEWVEQYGPISQTMNSSKDEPITFMPASEIGSMQHEVSSVRLFQS